MIDSGMVGLAPKWVRLDPKLDKSGTFSDQISENLTHLAKCTEIWSEKVPGLSNLGSNLTHFGAKPNIPGNDVVSNIFYNVCVYIACIVIRNIELTMIFPSNRSSKIVLKSSAIIYYVRFLTEYHIIINVIKMRGCVCVIQINTPLLRE